MAVRAAGQGKEALFVQFLKGSPSGEIAAMAKIPQIQVLRDEGDWKFFWQMNAQEKEAARERTEALFAKTMQALDGGQVELLVLDEALGACQLEYLRQDALQPLMTRCQGKTAGLEVILTGREPFGRALSWADYATEMRKVKHPYDRGIAARKGVEY